MADRFANFEELRQGKIECRHYRIRIRLTPSSVLVMAPHGCKIEPGTSELANMIAGDDFSFYSFDGIQRRNNYTDLHITSTNFDEPRAIEAVSWADTVVTIHGQGDETRSFVIIGGLHFNLSTRLRVALEEAGFSVELEGPGLEGRSERNICNRGRSGRGVQLEISRALRDELIDDEGPRQSFVNAVRKVLMCMTT